MSGRQPEAKGTAPTAPSEPAPRAPLSVPAPPRKILEAALFGFGGLLVGLTPLFLTALVVQALFHNGALTELGTQVALPMGIAGFLFAGMCGGFAAAWRLRPARRIGRRAAGQLSVLFAEAVVVVLILIRNPVETEPTGCSFFCFTLDQALGTLALIGWPVAAVGALIGAAFEQRRQATQPPVGMPATATER